MTAVEAQGNAERLKAYWTTGEGAAKIRWGEPGDFKRCVRLLTEETKGIGLDVEGYCANLHHRALGVWPGREHTKGAAPASKPPMSALPPTARETAAAAEALQVPALVTLPGVDIVAAGTWKLASGEQTFTTADLRHAVHAAQCPAVGNPVIKIGHLDPRFDGEPAVGRVANMALTQEGNKITGDLAGMPGWLGAVAASAYPRRSIEGTYDFQCQIGHLHPFVITGLALLGVTPPGVGVLGGLRDVAGLYGVQAAASTGASWRLEEAGNMTEPITARAITEMDVRRAYYESPGVAMSLWITELQMDPAQLIVADEATQKVYRVPFRIEAGAVSFGEATEVSVQYADIAASRGSGPILVWGSAAESRNLEPAAEAPYPVEPLEDPEVQAADDGDQGNIDTPYAGDLNTAARRYCARRGWAMPDGSYPIRDAAHHGENDLALAIRAVGRGSGSHDAIRRHIIKRASALGKSDAIPDNWTKGGSKEGGQAASAAEGPGIRIDAAGRHGAFTGTHSHPHAALGHQGGDETHDHSHSHKGEGRHAHVHAAGTTTGGQVDFTDEQLTALRSALGLGEDDELTPDRVVQAAGALRERADSRQVAAARALPPGVITVEQEAWDALHRRVQQGEEYRAAQLRGQRDQVIAAAVRAGKFSTAQVPKWERIWERDPDGARQVIAELHPNVVPVDDIGTPGGEDDVDSDYRRVFSKDYVEATRRPGA